MKLTVLLTVTFAVFRCIQGMILSRIINYTIESIDGTTQQMFSGYISYPLIMNKPAPGVVVAHDWNGRDDFENTITEKLGMLGYIAFAYDIYGEKGTGPEHNKRLMTPFINNRTLLLQRVKLAFEQLKLNGGRNLDTSKLGILGYCFGGLAVLDAARANLPGLKAAVVFHGFLNSPKDMKHEHEPISSSIMVFHGYDDKPIEAEIPNFGLEMSARKADWQLITYSNTDHAFTVPNQPRYNERSARRAWQTTKLFLREIFA